MNELINHVTFHNISILYIIYCYYMKTKRYKAVTVAQTVQYTASTASFRACTTAGFFSRNFSSKTSTHYSHKHTLQTSLIHNKHQHVKISLTSYVLCDICIIKHTQSLQHIITHRTTAICQIVSVKSTVQM